MLYSAGRTEISKFVVEGAMQARLTSYFWFYGVMVGNVAIYGGNDLLWILSKLSNGERCWLSKVQVLRDISQESRDVEEKSRAVLLHFDLYQVREKAP